MATKKAATKVAKKAPAKKADAKPKVMTVTVGSPEAKVGEITSDLKKMTTKSTKVAKITTPAQYQTATEMVVDVKKRIKRIKDLKTEYVKPLKDAVKNVESLFNTPLAAFEDLERVLKGGMSAYQVEQQRIAREAEEAARKEAEAKAAEAAEAGEVIDPTPVASPVERTETIARTADGSSASTKMVWRHTVTDVKAALSVPSTVAKVLALAVEKGLLDQVLRAEVKSGMREHAGVEIKEEVDIAVRA